MKFLGNAYRFRVAGDGSSSLRWPFPGSAGGPFEGFARWTSGPTRASNATYVVTGAAGTRSVRGDQRSAGGGWRTLGMCSLCAVQDNGGVRVDEADGVSAQHGGLPWFLDDMRPQGFMGRTFAHAHPELHLGNDPRPWNDYDVLRAIA